MHTSDNEGLNHEHIASDVIAAEEAVPLAAEIVSNVLKLTVQRVAPLVGMGAVNLILFVESNEAEIVVRLNKPQDDVAKSCGDYDKERWCIDQAFMAGVPGPNVLAVGEYAERAFMLQTRVPGANGKHCGMPATELLEIIGRYARQIHSLPANGFGDSVADFENGNALEGWRRYVDYNLGELTNSDPLLALGVYPLYQQGTIREVFTWLRRLPLRVGLNHCDLARRNTIVDETGRVYLLDWGCAEMHIVPHYDLNAFRRRYQPDALNLRAFLNGYGISAEEWSMILPELNALALLKGFDLTRWAIDRCPGRIAELAQSASRCLTVYQESEQLRLG